MTDLSDKSSVPLKWLVALVAAGLTGGVGLVWSASHWATSLENKIGGVEDELGNVANALDRIAAELTRRPTVHEINLLWKTAGMLNPDMQLPPQLDSDAGR